MLSATELAAMRETVESALPDTCTIQSATVGRDSIGAPTRAWTDRATGVACRLAARTVQERVLGEKATHVGDWVLTLAYDEVIEPGDQVLIGTDAYEVVGIDEAKSWNLGQRVGVNRVG